LSGTLYVVATPIGNLEDITYRAVRLLKECDLVACEDTRRTQKLLQHYGITKPMISLHEHNESDRAADLLEKLTEGVNIALVSDAGTPLISDPGYRLVREAVTKRLPVVPVPGASSILSALAAAGLPTDRFAFLGFLPPKTHARREELRRHTEREETLVFFEAPHRIVETLADVAEVLPGRPVVAARELTKMHEEFLRGSAAEVRGQLENRSSIQGEFTLLIGKAPKSAQLNASGEEIRAQVEALVAEGLPKKEAIKSVAKRLGLPKSQVYDHCTGG
jgi:16S rRNA (cytidine1402-2'-O)-methyltransferase